MLNRMASLASRFQGLLVIALLLASQTTAAAIAPTQVPHHVDAESQGGVERRCALGHDRLSGLDAGARGAGGLPTMGCTP